MSEATYSIPRHPDHDATVRQHGWGGQFFAVQSVCPCLWVGQIHVGMVGEESGRDARLRAERDAAAHRRSNG